MIKSNTTLIISTIASLASIVTSLIVIIFYVCTSGSSNSRLRRKKIRKCTITQRFVAYYAFVEIVSCFVVLSMQILFLVPNHFILLGVLYFRFGLVLGLSLNVFLLVNCNYKLDYGKNDYKLFLFLLVTSSFLGSLSFFFPIVALANFCVTLFSIASFYTLVSINVSYVKNSVASMSTKSMKELNLPKSANQSTILSQISIDDCSSENNATECSFTDATSNPSTLFSSGSISSPTKSHYCKQSYKGNSLSEVSDSSFTHRKSNANVENSSNQKKPAALIPKILFHTLSFCVQFLPYVLYLNIFLNNEIFYMIAVPLLCLGGVINWIGWLIWWK